MALMTAASQIKRSWTLVSMELVTAAPTDSMTSGDE